MKNLFFLLSFILFGTAAFANSNESAESFSKASVESIVLENSSIYSFSLNEVVFSDSDLLASRDCTLKGKFTITFSDGSQYSWEGTLTIVGQSCAEFLKELMAE